MAERDSRGGDIPGARAPVPAAVVANAHRIGQEVGRFSARAVTRLSELATAGLARVTVDPGTVSSSPPAGDGRMGRESTAPALDRAEAIVTRAGQRAAQLTGGLQERLMRSVATAREEAEDILVDAQELRKQGHDGAQRTP